MLVYVGVGVRARASLVSLWWCCVCVCVCVWGVCVFAKMHPQAPARVANVEEPCSGSSLSAGEFMTVCVCVTVRILSQASASGPSLRRCQHSLELCRVGWLILSCGCVCDQNERVCNSNKGLYASVTREKMGRDSLLPPVSIPCVALHFIIMRL